MVATTMETPVVLEAEVETEAPIEGGEVLIQKSVVKERKGEEGRTLRLRPGYMYRESNWEIGRAAERSKVKVREFVPGDRWKAWRKSTIRKAKTAEKKGLGRSVKAKK